VECSGITKTLRNPSEREVNADGCISLVINLFEDETRLYDPDDMSNVRKFNGCSVSGPHTKCLLSIPMNRPAWSAYRSPSGCSSLPETSGDELHNQHVGLDDLWRLASELRERVLAAQHRRELRIVEVALLERAAACLMGTQPLSTRWKFLGPACHFEDC